MKIKPGVPIYVTLFLLSTALFLAALVSTTFTDGMKISIERGDRYESSTSEEPAAPVDLNTATQEDLEALKGIGEKRAQAIIEYRETYGGFRSVEELLRVDGISEGVLEQIRDYITIS